MVTLSGNEFFLEDGSYLRLREAYVAYDIADLLNRVGTGRFFESFRLTLSGRNLLTFTDYSDFDPEVSHNGGDPRIRSLDEFTYPRFRTVTFGTNIRF